MNFQIIHFFKGLLVCRLKDPEKEKNTPFWTAGGGWVPVPNTKIIKCLLSLQETEDQ